MNGFNQHRQEEGESTDSFITSLYCLAEHCAYGALHDEMIRDRIVVRLRDANLSMKLQMDPNLTLDKAVAMARQSEAIKHQQVVVRGGVESNPSGVNAITRDVHKRRQGGDRQSEAKKGHFQSVCRSDKTAAAVQTVDDDSGFLGTVTAQVQSCSGKVGTDPWMVELLLNGSPIQFKTDTGADVSVLLESMFKQLRGVTLQASRSLSGPSQHPLQVCGQFTATLSHRATEVEEEMYVVQGLETALVGRPAIETMILISRVNTVKLRR